MKSGPHHYVLGHIALRKICKDNPLDFFSIMGSSQREDFLNDVWKQVRKNCDPEGAATFDIADVEITACRIKNFPAIVITMPPPSETAEAFFVAIILKIDPQVEELPKQPDFAYLTLEKGINMDGTERSVLCGWTTDDSHMNYGDGPEPTQEAFVAAVEKMI